MIQRGEGWCWDVAIVSRMAREGNQEANHMAYWEQSDRQKSQCKGPEAELCIALLQEQQGVQRS